MMCVARQLLAKLPMTIRVFGLGLLALHASAASAADSSDRGVTLEFVYEAAASVKSVCLAADFVGWDSEKLCLQRDELKSQKFRLQVPRPWSTEIQYKFVIDGKNWVRDPSNPNVISDGHGGSNSYISDTGFRDEPLLVQQPGTVAWKKRRLTLPFRTPIESEQKSDGLADTRDIVVAFPSSSWIQKNQRDQGRERPRVTVYFQDGLDYLNQAGAAALLSNLSQMPGMPIYTAVFVPPMDRTEEYGITDATWEYERFLLEQVIPAVENRWPTGGSARDRILIGPSLGGLVTLHLAARNPTVFGNAVSQSGSFWYREQETRDLIASFPDFAERGPRLFLEVGIWESEKMVAMNREVRTLLEAKGASLHYREYPTIHRWSAWKNRLREIFETLALGPAATRP
jgi:enterochelin esterase-like enzyme